MGLGEGTKDDQATILNQIGKILNFGKFSPRSEHSLARLRLFFSFLPDLLDVFEINEVSYEMATTEFGVDKWMI